jgi:hypothetical protein
MRSCQFDHSPNKAAPALRATSSNKTNSASKPVASGSKTVRSQLGDDFKPSDYSVICGRGQESFNHVGNCRFRILSSSFLESYSRAVIKAAKSAIVSDIVGTIRQAGGNFCKHEKGTWFEVGDHCAREKVSTLLRDLLHTQYRSSAKAKKAKLAHRRAGKLDKKENQQYGQQMVQGTGDSDDSSTASTSSSSSSLWGSSMDSLGGDSLPDDVFFDMDYVF